MSRKSERIVANMGAEYRKETADAIGNICMALKNKNIAIKPTTPRNMSMGGLLPFMGILNRFNSIKPQIAEPKDRKNTSWMVGRWSAALITKLRQVNKSAARII